MAELRETKDQEVSGRLQCMIHEQLRIIGHKMETVLNTSEEPSRSPSLKKDQKESKRLEALKLAISILRVFGVLQVVEIAEEKEFWGVDKKCDLLPQVLFSIQDKWLMGIFCLMLGAVLVCMKRQGLFKGMEAN
jgi:hypothetical protein